MNAQVAGRYRGFAAWALPTSPLYAGWAAGIADDPELTARIAALGHRRGQPNLVFAAARAQGCPLVAFAPWRSWVLDHWDGIAAVTAVRSTQTNEVGRCATLLPALAGIDGPVALLEPGTAGGLCLHLDRYGYDYVVPGGETVTLAAASTAASTVRLPCRVDDAAAIPTRMPEVVWRAGIDLHPIDVHDPDELAWLELLVWPGPAHDGRVARLRAAAAAAPPTRIVAGDLFAHLADVAAESPADATLVIFHSAVLLYLDAVERARFSDLVTALGARLGRRVAWLANETAGALARVDARLPAGLESTGRFVQSLDERPIALAGQHGATYETVPFTGR